VSAAFEAVLEAAASAELHRRTGTVVRTTGEMVTVTGLNLRPHELAFVMDAGGRPLPAECAGASSAESHLAMLERGPVSAGARVVASGRTQSSPAGGQL